MESQSPATFITYSRETIQLLTRCCYIDLPCTGRGRSRHRPSRVCSVCAHAAVVHKNNTNESVCHYGEQLLGKNSASFKLYGRRLTCSSIHFVSNIQDYALFFYTFSNNWHFSYYFLSGLYRYAQLSFLYVVILSYYFACYNW